MASSEAPIQDSTDLRPVFLNGAFPIESKEPAEGRTRGSSKHPVLSQIFFSDGELRAKIIQIMGGDNFSCRLRDGQVYKLNGPFLAPNDGSPSQFYNRPRESFCFGPTQLLGRDLSRKSSVTSVGEVIRVWNSGHPQGISRTDFAEITHRDHNSMREIIEFSIIYRIDRHVCGGPIMPDFVVGQKLVLSGNIVGWNGADNKWMVQVEQVVPFGTRIQAEN